MRFADGEWLLVDHDFPTGRTTWVRYEADGSETYRVDYPVAKTLEANAAERAEGAGQRWGEWKRVASVPLGLAMGEGYLAQAWDNDDQKALSRWLNDAENRNFRTFEGAV